MIIGYKVAKSGDTRVIITLEIPPDALTNMERKSVAIRETAKYRTNMAMVLMIDDSVGNKYNTSTSCGYIFKSLIYNVGEMIVDPYYNTNIKDVCAEGIHYFLSRHVAELYNVTDIHNGLYESWYDNGHKNMELTYINGKLNGPFRSWYETGKIAQKGLTLMGSFTDFISLGTMMGRKKKNLSI
jgi:hypothetical protein